MKLACIRLIAHIANSGIARVTVPDVPITKYLTKKWYNTTQNEKETKEGNAALG